MEEIKTDTPEQPKAGGYKVDNVLLIESSFSREAVIDFNECKISSDFNIEATPHETSTDNKFSVTLSIDFKGKQNEKQICQAKISMVGFFEKTGEPPLTEELFKKINAPAIIYPFIREHLHNICFKAGIANMFLPTVNFKP